MQPVITLGPLIAGAEVSFNTASGKNCCNDVRDRFDAVELKGFNTASGKNCCNELKDSPLFRRYDVCFNTASGKNCCNFQKRMNSIEKYAVVSILQAVRTVATFKNA